MSVLLTGGSGFVGLNVAEQLLAAGQDVVIFDASAPPRVFTEAVASLPGTLSVTRGDVRDRRALIAAIRDQQVDRLVHGAAITAGAERELTGAGDIIGVNTGGTVEVLEGALAGGVTRVVQLSSGAMFGTTNSLEQPLDEVADSPVPDSLYGISKYAAERVGLRYRAIRGLDLVVARLGVTFGRWEYDTGVRDTLSLPYQLTTLAGAGRKARFCMGLPSDWVYADDVARAIIGLLNAAEVPGSVYHLATGQEWSASDWSERLMTAFPAFSYEIVATREEANVARQAPTPRAPFAIDRLQTDLGYVPAFLPEQAFENYLAWWRQQPGHGR